MERAWDSILAILAVQLKGVRGEDVAATWTAKSTQAPGSLGERLVQAGTLSVEDVDLLENLARHLVEIHGGDVDAAFDSLGGFDRASEYLAVPTASSSLTATTPMERAQFESAPIGEENPLDELPGRYTRISEHGKGGMGRVLLVHDVKMGREVALKELMPESGSSSGLNLDTPIRGTTAVASRFLQEGRITAGLEHPSIVPVYELGRRPNGRLYYTMRLVRGRTLSDALKDCRSLAERLALLPHFIDLCQAIAYAHSRGVVHRDIKPSNVMVGEFGETVVLDWGLAKVTKEPDDPLEQDLREMPERLAKADANGSPQTAAGAVMGTPDYMAPEQARGETERIGEQSDVYALGVMLYQLLTGATPFSAPSSSQILKRVVEEEARPVSELEPEAPPELEAVCHKAIHKAQEGRYGSAKELAEEVERYLTGALVKSYRYGPSELLGHFYRRYRAVVVTAAGALLVLASVGIVSFLQVYVARNREHTQRLQAEEARDVAVAAKERTKEARERAEHKAYVAQIRLAQSYVRERNFAQANGLLSSMDEERRNWEWAHLLEQCNQDLFTLRGHESIVFRLHYSPEGSRILTVAGDKTARLWHSRDGAPIALIQVPTALIMDGQFSPDGSTVVVALRDGTARLYDAEDGHGTGVLKGHTGGVNTARFLGDGAKLITASDDRTVRVWDMQTREELARLEGHEGNVAGAYASHDATYFASVTRQGTIRCWRANEQIPMRTLTGALLEFAPSAPRLAFVNEGVAVVWDLSTDQEVFSSDRANDVERVRFTPDGERVLTASRDGVARLYSLSGGQLLASYNHGEEARDARMSPDQALVMVFSNAGLVTVWDASTGALLNQLAGHEGGIASAVISPDSRRIATGSRDCTARIWDAREPITRSTLATCSKGVTDLSASLDGRHVALVSQDRTLRLLDGATFQEAGVHAAFSQHGPSSVALSADGGLVSAPLDGFAVFVLEADSGRPISLVCDHRGRVSAVAFSPVDDRMVSAGADGTIRIWDPRTEVQAIVIEQSHGTVKHAAFSRDGRRLATAARDGTVGLWDAESGAAVHVLTGHTRGAAYVSFAPDGRSLMSCGKDGLVIRWSVETGEIEGMCTGHAEEVGSAVYSQDGTRVFTASWDRTARVWDAETLEELLVVTHKDAALRRAWMPPNGRRLVLAGHDGKVVVHYAAPWLPEHLEDCPGATVEERFSKAKYRRTAERLQARVEQEAVAVLVHTTPDRLKRHVGLLRRALDGSASAPPSEGEEVQGLTLNAGPRANAVARLCLETEDVITRVAGVPVDSLDAARHALDALLDPSAPLPAVSFDLLRAGKPMQLQYSVHEPVVKEHAVSLSREEAGEIVQFIKLMTEMGKDSLIGINYDNNVRIGEPPEERLALNGFWLPSGGPPQAAQVLAQLGLAEGDRILSVNDVDVRSFSQVQEFVAKAVVAVEEPGPIALDVLVDRGEFQSIRIQIGVE
ncbi:MAG: protein kinase [bacterium]|nr:protein kinase [bacterium]